MLSTSARIVAAKASGVELFGSTPSFLRASCTVAPVFEFAANAAVGQGCYRQVTKRVLDQLDVDQVRAARRCCRSGEFRCAPEAIYDGRLTAHPSTEARHLMLRPDAPAALKQAGLSFVAVDHGGCAQSSRPEAEAIRDLIAALCAQKVIRNGRETSLNLDDILVVAPYNLQVNLLRQTLPGGAKIGAVDKFQGQEAPVVIVSMTTSRGADAPRGTEFLFNPHRLNVAISRAQCLALVVHGSQLLEGAWTKIEDLRRLNLFAHGEAVSQ
jgi:hypothetical protein